MHLTVRQLPGCLDARALALILADGLSLHGWSLVLAAGLQQMEAADPCQEGHRLVSSAPGGG